MSPWNVEWVQAALDELAAIWIDATNRNAVTDAVREIDRRLAFDPQAAGRHLVEGLFVAEVSPPRAFYTFDLVSRSVQVEAVHSRDKGRSQN